MIVFHSSSAYSSGCLRMLVPALLIRISSRPNFFTAALISARHDSAAVTSTATASALAPTAASFLTAAALFASSRPATTIAAPASARPCAMPKPIPPLPPVTIATRPPRSKSAISLLPSDRTVQSLGRGGLLCQCGAKADRDDEEHDPGEDEDHVVAERIDPPAAHRDAGGLAEEIAEGEERDGEPARLRRHLRRVRLQRVVQHVEAGADRGDHRRDAPRHRRDCDQAEPDGQRDAAGKDEAALAEPGDEKPHRRRVGKPAEAERGEERADRQIAQYETVAQIGAEIDEAAEEEESLDEGGGDDDANAAYLQQREVARDQRAAVVAAMLHDARGAYFEGQQGGDDEIDRAEDDEDAAPADRVAEEAAKDLAEDDAEDLAGEEAREHGLAVLVGDHIAEIGHGERDDGACGGAAEQPQHAEPCEAVGEGTGRHRQPGQERRDCDHRVFAEAVAERADEDLAKSIRHGEGGSDHRGAAGGGAELAGDLRQQGVGDAQRRR